MDQEIKEYIDSEISKVLSKADDVFGRVKYDMTNVQERLKKLEES